MTEKARSPSVVRRVVGMTSVDLEDSEDADVNLRRQLS